MLAVLDPPDIVDRFDVRGLAHGALLVTDDGRVLFRHRCDRARRAAGVVVACPELRIGQGHYFDATTVTVHPSILCDDCGTHGFVTAGRWQPASRSTIATGHSRTPPAASSRSITSGH